MDMDGVMGTDAILAGRERQSLDGTWDFAHASDGVWRKATVPAPWQAEFADLAGRPTDANSKPPICKDARRFCALALSAIRPKCW
jgi:hypothetical protein